MEKEIRERLLSMKGDLPETNYVDLSLTRHPVDTRLTPEETQLFWVKELLLGNIQRCSCFLEQLDEVKSTMLKVRGLACDIYPENLRITITLLRS